MASPLGIEPFVRDQRAHIATLYFDGIMQAL